MSVQEGHDEDEDSCKAMVSSASMVADDNISCRKQECGLSVMCNITQVGDVLAVVGSDAVFGGWDVSRALKLVTTAAEYPRWSTRFATPEANSEFKLLIQHPNGSITWEPIKSNRVWPTDASGRFIVSARYGQLDDSQTVNDILGA